MCSVKAKETTINTQHTKFYKLLAVQRPRTGSSACKTPVGPNYINLSLQMILKYPLYPTHKVSNMCGVQTFGHLGCFSRAQNRQLSLQNISRTKLHKSELADDLKTLLISNTQSFKECKLLTIQCFSRAQNRQLSTTPNCPKYINLSLQMFSKYPYFPTHKFLDNSMKINFGPGSSIFSSAEPVTAGRCSGQPPALRMSIESLKSTDSNKKTIRS